MNKVIIGFMAFLLFTLYTYAGIRGIPMEPSKYVGNAGGRIIDATTGKPIAGAKVYLLAPNSDPRSLSENHDGGMGIA